LLQVWEQKVFNHDEEPVNKGNSRSYMQLNQAFDVALFDEGGIDHDEVRCCEVSLEHHDACKVHKNND
jgi:hypothetical protein